MKRKKLVLLIMLASLTSFMLTGCLDDEDYYDDYSDYYEDEYDDDYYDEDDDFTETVSKGNGNTKASERIDTEDVTVMIYMCGADLESEGGAATADINEIVYSEVCDNANVIIQTGGCSEWQNSIISSDVVERYKASSEGLEFIESVGNVPMTDTDTLSDFIRFCAENYPSDRYMFIFWDHGGGTASGYGVDENFDGKSMSIDEIEDAFAMADVKFDIIGFDCCLMATVETAAAVSNYADYLLASEETEPGTGWYYTNFMNLLEEDPGVSPYDLASLIIEDFNDASNTYIDDGVTLSLVDLSQIDNIVSKLGDYLANSENYLVNSNGFRSLSGARANARDYGEGEFEQIDMIDYLDQIDIDGGDALREAIETAVIYNGTNMRGSNGLAMYYPYLAPEYYSEIHDVIAGFDFINNKYDSYMNSFLTVLNGGKINGTSNYNPHIDESTVIEEDYGYVYESDWYDEDLANEYSDEYASIDSDILEITDKDDYYALSLSDEDWDNIVKIELEVYLDDGEGYLALGSDDWYEFDDDGDLIVDYDFSWLYINDSLVPYFAYEEAQYSNGDWYCLGFVPAELNGNQDINIWILKPDEGDYEVLGYTIDYENGAGNKGYKQFKDGDTLEFYFDYYDYDGNYDDAYSLEDNTLIYDSSVGLETYYDELADSNFEIDFKLTDIYQNEYWTESVVYGE